MKKVLASTLAVMMAASMTSVAFADSVDATSIKVDENSKVYMDNDGILVPVDVKNLVAKPGESIYVQILPGNAGENITSKVAGNHKVVLDWNQGKELVESAAIENKKVSDATGAYKFNGADAPYGLNETYNSIEELKAAIEAVKVHNDAAHTDGTPVEGCVDESHSVSLTEEAAKAALEGFKAESKTSYRYVAAIKLKKSFSVEKKDLLGSVKVLKKSYSASHDAPSMDLNAVVGYEKVMASDTVEVTNDAPVVSFEEYNEETELIFGTLASFSVDVRNQEKDLYLGYSMKPDTDILDQNEDASIDFLTFEAKPTFTRIGKMRIFADKDSFLYEKTSKGLKKLDAKYDEEQDAFVLETRTLGSYVISDMELKYTAGVEDSTPSEDSSSSGSQNGGSNTSKPSNPSTGAAGLSGMAGLSGLSLLAALFTGKKKFGK